MIDVMNNEDKKELLEAMGVLIDTRVTSAVSELAEVVGALATHVDQRFEQMEVRMDRLDTRMDRLDTRMDRLDTRIDSIELRMDGVEGHIGSLTQEVRIGYQKLDTRLSAVEEEVHAISATLDRQFEGEVLGTDHITLIRPEYDGLVKVTNLPNRFAESA